MGKPPVVSQLRDVKPIFSNKKPFGIIF